MAATVRVTGDHVRVSALPVDADEDLALGQVGAVELAGRMRPGAGLEHHGNEPQAGHGVLHRLALGGQFLQRRAGEDPDPLIGRADHRVRGDGGHGISLFLLCGGLTR